MEKPESQIRLHLSELLPTGEHIFTLEPPHYLYSLLEYPYLAMATFQANRPTGGSSWNPITRRLYYRRLRIRLSQLLEATCWLEDAIRAWKETSAETLPRAIAQAEDLLWYMRQEPMDPRQSAIFEAVRATKLETPEDKQRLFDHAVNLLAYLDSLRDRSTRHISADERFVIEIRGTNAYFLMEVIARRLDTSSDDLLDKARLIVSDLVLPSPGDCFG